MITIPLLRPLLPGSEQLRPWLEQIDDNRFYANGGPLQRQLQARLTAHFGLAGPYQITLLANATLGLMLALRAMANRSSPGYCLMPSWSFAATGHAAYWAGLEPYFLDVDRASGVLDVAACYEAVERLGRHQIGAVVVVSYLGAPVAAEPWLQFRERTGIPVLLDAAAGFDSCAAGPLPAVVSLHATKIFSTGEGGCVLCDDAALIEQIETMVNFGFDRNRDVVMPGINAKMSEYNAAVGLAFFELWPRRRALTAAKLQRYGQGLARDQVARPSAGMGARWVASMYAVDLLHFIAAEAIAALARAGIEARVWWGRGMHETSLFRRFGRTALPATESFAETSVGLPFYPDIPDAAIDRVCEVLADLAVRKARRGNAADLQIA